MNLTLYLSDSRDKGILQRVVRLVGLVRLIRLVFRLVSLLFRMIGGINIEVDRGHMPFKPVPWIL